MDERCRRLQWQIDHASSVLPLLEARLAAARAEGQRRGLARHRKIMAALHPKLRAAVIEAGRIQQEVIAARQAACAELGEGLVNKEIPILAYRGLILPDLIQQWAAEMDRIFAPKPKPAAIAVRPQPPARPAPAPVKASLAPPAARPVTSRDASASRVATRHRKTISSAGWSR